MRRAIKLFRRCTESLDRVVCHSLSHVRVIPKRRSRNFSPREMITEPRGGCQSSVMTIPYTLSKPKGKMANAEEMQTKQKIKHKKKERGKVIQQFKVSFVACNEEPRGGVVVPPPVDVVAWPVRVYAS